MTDPQDPLLLDHEADGIRELDNQLPRWWVWLFNLSIAFSVVYMVYYHVLGDGRIMVTEYQREMEVGDRLKSAALARFEQAMQELQPGTEPATLDTGRRLFNQMCAPCPREDGGGLVGPNLTDDYWIHGPSFGDSLRVIYDGVPDKGMVTWKTLLKPAEIHAVASHIYTLRGTNPPNPKPREDQAPPDQPSEYE
ncbi:MAG: c-type cytochrome [Verrucomicrobiales bacterium]|nr:c-type cytochrome [Verrucomicrobiales bacterium]